MQRSSLRIISIAVVALCGAGYFGYRYFATDVSAVRPNLSAEPVFVRLAPTQRSILRARLQQMVNAKSIANIADLVESPNDSFNRVLAQHAGGKKEFYLRQFDRTPAAPNESRLAAVCGEHRIYWIFDLRRLRPLPGEGPTGMWRTNNLGDLPLVNREVAKSIFVVEDQKNLFDLGDNIRVKLNDPLYVSNNQDRAGLAEFRIYDDFSKRDAFCQAQEAKIDF